MSTSSVIVLGGCGAVGSHAARTLALHDAFERVIVADLDLQRSRQLVAQWEVEGVEALRVDVSDPAGLRQALAGVDLVLNCTGPFYALAVPILEAVLDAGVTQYVDVCDDVDATLQLLEMDARAKEAGVCALMGMGNSPGVTNLLGRLAADFLLDEVEAVDIFHAHGGEPFEGAGVIAHRLHGMEMEIPMFLDGELRYVRFFEPEGIALRDRVDLHLVGEDVPVYPYPHPEQITMPQHLELRRVTNRGTVLPDEYFQLTTEMARLGLTSGEPLEVGGRSVAPLDFTIAFLLSQRDAILERTGFGSQRGCAKVVARGTRRGEYRQYNFSMASEDQALGEGTGIPAAMGAILMQQGKVSGYGVFPPEACVKPMDFMGLVKPVLELSQKGGSFQGIVIEKVDAEGNVEQVDLPF